MHALEIQLCVYCEARCVSMRVILHHVESQNQQHVDIQ